MKKVLVLALSTIILISGLPANAAIKAGAVCKTKGQVKVSGGKEFTCVKKGSKLVWSKGKIVITVNKVNKTPAPTVSSTPTPSSTPTELSTPSPSASSEYVSPGAFCSPDGATGKSAKGVEYTCKTSATDTRSRWRQ
ncbi:hypothetical protein MCEMZLE22_01265 [actinobacterium SCGC AAA044-D11]